MAFNKPNSSSHTKIKIDVFGHFYSPTNIVFDSWSINIDIFEKIILSGFVFLSMGMQTPESPERNNLLLKLNNPLFLTKQ